MTISMIVVVGVPVIITMSLAVIVHVPETVMIPAAITVLVIMTLTVTVLVAVTVAVKSLGQTILEQARGAYLTRTNECVRILRNTSNGALCSPLF